jgi:hypothetical protein
MKRSTRRWQPVCPTCGEGLEVVLAWACLVTEEPAEMPYRGPWGIDATWTVGGAEEVSVTCPHCSIPSTVGRHCPVACV